MTANPKPCRLLVRAPVMVPAFALVTALAMAPAPDPRRLMASPKTSLNSPENSPPPSSISRPARPSEAAPAPAPGASHLVPYCILLLAVAFFGVLVLSYLRLPRTDEAGGGNQLESAGGDATGTGELVQSAPHRPTGTLLQA